jgi:hypothetical protein
VTSPAKIPLMPATLPLKAQYSEALNPIKVPPRSALTGEKSVMDHLVARPQGSPHLEHTFARDREGRRASAARTA